MIGSHNAHTNFNEFINEARGFSSSANEYALLVKKKVDETLDKYLAFNFKKRFVNYSEDIEIPNAASLVSPEVAESFPIDEIIVKFRISAMKKEQFMSHSASYQRNYNKYNLVKGKGEKVNLNILCKIVVPYEGLTFNREYADQIMSDIFRHEFTHAFNDYKDPNFAKGYRLGVVPNIAKRFDVYQESAALRLFFNLLYVLTDVEIAAISGERESFADRSEFQKYPGTQWADTGKIFDPYEFHEMIMSDIEGKPYAGYIDNNFGEFFVDIYNRAAHAKRMHKDPKVLQLKKGSSLLDTLKFFTPYIHEQAVKLWKNLAKKIAN